MRRCRAVPPEGSRRAVVPAGPSVRGRGCLPHGARRWPALPLLAGLLGAVLASPSAATAVVASPPAAQESPAYYPGPGDEWERRPPAAVGMDTTRLQAAVEFAIANESSFGPDLEAALRRRLATGPHGEIVGPVKERGGPNGIVVRHGYIVAEWGDTERVDMTFSISKSYLSTVAGLARDEGLIRDLQAPVHAHPAVPDSLFDTDRERTITWHHLLTQTSEWEGNLWGKPDVADRRRGEDRALQPPGSFFEYNDVRVNLTALALLHVWGRPLPEVLEERVMDPIGASDDWEWHGYRTSWIGVDGRRVQSVSGGGHWGGGVWIGSRDQARFGYLFLREGRWKDGRVLSEERIRRATTPSEVEPRYGYMWWLNTEGRMWPGVPEESYAALGAGTNAIWVCPEHDLVVVVRWIEGEKLGEFLEKVLAAVDDAGAEQKPGVEVESAAEVGPAAEDGPAAEVG